MAYFDRNLIVRVTTTVVAIPILAYVVFLGGMWMFGGLLLVGFVTLWEYGAVVAHHDKFARALLLVLGTGVIAAGMLAENTAVALLVPQLAALAIAIVYCLRPGDLDTVWARMSALAFGLIYIGLGNITVYKLRQYGAELPERTTAVVWVWLPLAVAWCNDSAAYFVGKAIGKNKLYPLLSPKKTWEGFVGGALGGILIPFGLLFAFRPWLADVHPIDIFFVAVPAIFLAPVGDLIESMMKRSYNIKDAGSLLPGHGGFLDRIDAVYLVAPWTLLYVAAIRPTILGG